MMSTNLPAKARVEVVPYMLHDGLFGLVQTVAHAMQLAAQQSADEKKSAAPPDLDELLLVSGAAFRNYMPELSAGESPTSRPDHLVKYVCSWGAFESLSYYYGWDLKEFLTLNLSDFWKLLQFEIASGRPVVTLDSANAMQPMLVVGYAIEKVERPGDERRSKIGLRRSLEVLRAGAKAHETVDMSDVEDFQPDTPELKNWMLIARPSAQPEYAPNPQYLRLRVLRWAVAHAKNRRELSQEFGRQYASGHRAFGAFLAHLDALGAAAADSKDEPLGTRDPDWARFVRGHVEELSRARAAAARHLRRWAQELAQDAEFFPEPEPAFQAAMLASADAFEQVSRALQGRAGDDDDIAQLRGAYQSAFDAEVAATAALAQALSYLPGAL